MENLGKWLHESVKEVVQDLVFEAKKTDYRELSKAFKDKFGHEPSVFLQKSSELNDSLPRGWWTFLKSIPTLETNGKCHKIRPLINNESASESNEHCNVSEMWATASFYQVCSDGETLVDYRHRLIIQAYKHILTTSDVNAANADGNTPLHLISALPSNSEYHAKRNENLLTLLLSSGADPRKQNKDGFTPLHLVAGRIFLVKNRADGVPPDRMPTICWSSEGRLQQAKVLTNTDLYTDESFKFSTEEIQRVLQQWNFTQSSPDRDIDNDSLCAFLVSLTVGPTAELNSPVKVNIKSEVHKAQLKHLCDSSNPPRRILNYRYDTNMVIGEGAMSQVFLAVDEKGRREAALKRMQRDYKNLKLAREIRALCEGTSCEQVIDFYGIIEDVDFNFIAIELMEGDLARLVRDRKDILSSATQITKFVRDMVKGLTFLHKKSPTEPIIHRDLKPGNVLYRTHPELCLKLADFGLAKDLTGYSSLASTSIHAPCGTRGWMAPELVSRQCEEHTKESDVFALGLVSHFLMSMGRHPYDADGVVLTDLGTQKLILHKVEQSIEEGNLHIHSSLSYEAKHVLRSILTKDSRKRPPAKSIQHHCYFWSDHKKIQFLKAVGDQKEVAQVGKHTGAPFAARLKQSELGRRLLNQPWDQDVPVLYKEMTNAWKHKTYSTTSAVELIRFFRNAYSHEEERFLQSKADLMANVFFQKFPDLVLTVRSAVLEENWHQPNTNRDRQTILRALELQ